jgi:hypothetical protein
MASVKHFRQSFCRRNAHFPHQGTPFKEELQLRHRELQSVITPYLGKAPLLEPLRVEAEAGAIPHQDLRTFPIARDEQVQITR